MIKEERKKRKKNTKKWQSPVLGFGALVLPFLGLIWPVLGFGAPSVHGSVPLRFLGRCPACRKPPVLGIGAPPVFGSVPLRSLGPVPACICLQKKTHNKARTKQKNATKYKLYVYVYIKIKNIHKIFTKGLQKSKKICKTKNIIVAKRG